MDGAVTGAQTGRNLAGRNDEVICKISVWQRRRMNVSCGQG